MYYITSVFVMQAAEKTGLPISKTDDTEKMFRRKDRQHKKGSLCKPPFLHLLTYNYSNTSASVPNI